MVEDHDGIWSRPIWSPEAAVELVLARWNRGFLGLVGGKRKPREQEDE
jgi:hypothetical protein